MNDNFFDFASTNQALGALSETILKLEMSLKSKQNSNNASIKELQNALVEKESQIEALKMASSSVVQNIDNIINSLDNVLEKYGSSNNNN